MGGYVSLPAHFDATSAAPWIAKSLAYVGTLPPKAKAKPTAKKR
jgi:hypothetical protein